MQEQRDLIIGLRDIRDLEKEPVQLGSIAAHTRPVEALAFVNQTDFSGVLYTTDSLGAVKVWDVHIPNGNIQDCRIILKDEWESHRTGINAVSVGDGLMITGTYIYQNDIPC